MKPVVREEPVHYHAMSSGVAEMPLSTAEARMDWEAYDKRMDARLQSAVEGCAAGTEAVQIEEAFETLLRRRDERRAGAIA
ncbi:MAG: hypothetical protein IAE77_10865 [Prosthecobacter sp.]|uniref:hypothetical protein n=1 Tax=Prosthecobacter sp. TaxID=1965333 RepID=UPI0019EE4F42|nr:hypothetical protein [Prosthecobacter sp.]MBE2283947.1 hypothetical protein [Prosthecobacter sp.]